MEEGSYSRSAEPRCAAYYALVLPAACFILYTLASASGFDPPAWSYGDCSAASRSKPLAEGWLWRVCALAFQAGRSGS